jgi:hypothetical protein
LAISGFGMEMLVNDLWVRIERNDCRVHYFLFRRALGLVMAGPWMTHGGELARNNEGHYVG